MSKRLDVPNALAAAIATALPDAVVLGPLDDPAAAATIGAGGRVVVTTGDPGKPDIDLSPLTYNWAHDIEIELIAPDETILDAMLVAIGAMLLVDRTLGGAVEWIDAAAPATEELDSTSGLLRTARPVVTAIYATNTPI